MPRRWPKKYITEKSATFSFFFFELFGMVRVADQECFDHELSAPPPDPCLASGMAPRVGLGGHQGESVIPDSLFTRTTLCGPDSLYGHQKSYFHLSAVHSRLSLAAMVYLRRNFCSALDIDFACCHSPSDTPLEFLCSSTSLSWGSFSQGADIRVSFKFLHGLRYVGSTPPNSSSICDTSLGRGPPKRPRWTNFNGYCFGI